MRNSFRFWMQDSTGHTTPPDTAPLFGPRLRAWLGSLLGRPPKFSDGSPMFSADQPLRVRDFSRQVLEEQLKLLHADRAELRAKERATRARADMLNAAIQYACSGDMAPADPLEWLMSWNEGDEEADDMLRAWMESDDGKDMLGSTVVGRNGLYALPTAVGHERPEPAAVQPAQGDPGYLYAPKVPDAVPFYTKEIKPMPKTYPSAAQPWLNTIPVMQQSVLFSGIRGMDGLRKLHPAKMLVRFYRRCVLISAFEGATLAEPYSPGGGDFTGPSLQVVDGKLSKLNPKGSGYIECGVDEWPAAMFGVVDDFVRARDEMPLHYFSHMMHAFQIVGANHPDETIRLFWYGVYTRMVHALHLFPEAVDELDRRLGDTEAGWKEREDCAGSCST